MQANTDRSPEETAEIERHKYFMSEEAGHDVGWERAEKDWEENHAQEYRVMMGTPTRAGVGGMIKKFFGKS